MNDEEIKNEIRKFALQNAAQHDGKTRDKTIPVTYTHLTLPTIYSV